MHQGLAELTEIYLDEKSAGRIRCDSRLLPAPGQYLLAYNAADLSAPLAYPVFSAGLCPGGFYAAPALPQSWLPGTQLHIRGPLGNGFSLPKEARFVALAAFSATCARLLALVESALAQKASIVLLTDNPPDGLPAAIEISPLSALTETLRWADTVALDTSRAALPGVLKLIMDASYSGYGQILVETSIPCGGMGQCGVCTVRVRNRYQLGCKDGPVFDLRLLLE